MDPFRFLGNALWEISYPPYPPSPAPYPFHFTTRLGRHPLISDLPASLTLFVVYPTVDILPVSISEPLFLYIGRPAKWNVLNVSDFYCDSLSLVCCFISGVFERVGHLLSAGCALQRPLKRDRKWELFT